MITGFLENNGSLHIKCQCRLRGLAVIAQRPTRVYPRRMCQQSEILRASDKLFASYLEFQRLGLRAKAKEAAQAIVNSVPSLDAKDAWTRTYLNRLPMNGHSRIRHEIYREIIFPTLRVRYEKDDPEASYLLGKTWNNFISEKVFAEQIGFHSRGDFFERAYMGEPSSERYRLAFLGALIAQFNYLFHEWPTGILVSHENVSAELMDLKTNIELASSLDKDRQHAVILRAFSEKTDIYIDRLSGREPRL